MSYQRVPSDGYSRYLSYPLFHSKSMSVIPLEETCRKKVVTHRMTLLCPVAPFSLSQMYFLLINDLIISAALEPTLCICIGTVELDACFWHSKWVDN
ncbi:hypothetical protein A4A49_02933 [Nicotiana attenuata]|uniref:Uncharacterized protein n=1 Tax=Nicotiana attenuata TaxID=49451 RepID=A0A314LC16_NICAT|nr:hypothetical protein A4A49_02933 [Nicotiana attenuata]